MCRSPAAKSVGVVATPASPPRKSSRTRSRTASERLSASKHRRPRSTRRPDPGARRVSTGAGPQAGPGRRTARRASPRTRPDAPPPRPASARPSESRAPPCRDIDQVGCRLRYRDLREAGVSEVLRQLPQFASRDARRRWPSAPDADELGVALCHELGCDAGADSAVTKVRADRLTCDAQQGLRRCRSHSPSGHQPTGLPPFSTTLGRFRS